MKRPYIGTGPVDVRSFLHRFDWAGLGIWTAGFILGFIVGAAVVGAL